jgi:hypothetical protein
MTAKTNHARRASPQNAEADIDLFLADHHDAVVEKLAAGRAEIMNGEATPLEPLDELLRDARAGR